MGLSRGHLPTIYLGATRHATPGGRRQGYGPWALCSVSKRGVSTTVPSRAHYARLPCVCLCYCHVLLRRQHICLLWGAAACGAVCRVHALFLFVPLWLTGPVNERCEMRDCVRVTVVCLFCRLSLCLRMLCVCVCMRVVVRVFVWFLHSRARLRGDGDGCTNWREASVYLAPRPRPRSS